MPSLDSLPAEFLEKLVRLGLFCDDLGDTIAEYAAHIGLPEGSDKGDVICHYLDGLDIDENRIALDAVSFLTLEPSPLHSMLH